MFRTVASLVVVAHGPYLTSRQGAIRRQIKFGGAEVEVADGKCVNAGNDTHGAMSRVGSEATPSSAELVVIETAEGETEDEGCGDQLCQMAAKPDDNVVLTMKCLDNKNMHCSRVMLQ